MSGPSPNDSDEAAEAEVSDVSAEADVSDEPGDSDEASASNGGAAQRGPVDHDASADAVVRRADAVEYESVHATDGMTKGVLLDEGDGTPTFGMRRFTLDPGAEVPKHTNEVEHVQYVLDGEFVVGIDHEEHAVRAGDSLFIPAGTVHWYRNDADEVGAFICAVPHGNDEIQLLE